MNIKDQLNKLINELVNNSNSNELWYKQYVLQSIEDALEQVKNNKFVDFNIVKEQFNAKRYY